MSLQVWLPLNGNLNNQGLMEVTTSNTPVYASGGKFGKCLSNQIAISGYGDALQPSHTRSVSISCWFKCTTSDYLIACNAWEFRCSPSFVQFRLGNGGTNTYPATSPNKAKADVWNHIAGTWDSENKIVKVYLNGNLEASSQVSSDIDFNPISSAFTLPYNGTNTYVNDLRMYNHCLSPKEVKEISKGLICHYKLDNNGFGNPNLLITQSPTYFSRQGNKYTNTAADTRTNDIFNLQYYRGSTHVSTFFTKDVSTTPCDVKTTFTVPENVTGIRVKFNGESRDLELFMPGRAPVVAGETYTLSLRVLSSKSEVVGGVQVENPKLEKGSVATPWCPHTSDSLYTSLGLDSTAEPDCSGYLRNANKVNSPASLPGSPRYEVGCKFTGSEYLTFPNPLTSSSTEFSISCWARFDNASDTMTICTMRASVGSGIALFKVGSNFRFDDNAQTTFSDYSIPINTWLHLVVTRSSSSKNLYINGNLVQSATTVGDMGELYTTGSIGASSASGGNLGNFTKGAFSDFRIYSTVLSASDVKELYSTSASVDKNGNMYAYEFKEE